MKENRTLQKKTRISAIIENLKAQTRNLSEKLSKQKIARKNLEGEYSKKGTSQAQNKDNQKS